MRKLIMALVVLFGMFAASAATIEFYKPNEDKPYFSCRSSIKDESDYKIYDLFAKEFVLNTESVGIICNSDEHYPTLALRLTYPELTGVLTFGIYDVEDLDEFRALIHKYEETK